MATREDGGARLGGAREEGTATREDRGRVREEDVGQRVVGRTLLPARTGGVVRWRGRVWWGRSN
ncbi:MAG: hypothetical protein IKW42_04920, partial [Alistipes sp.]|nr:hypothetical protein [Alistipes sp.]